MDIFIKVLAIAFILMAQTALGAEILVDPGHSPKTPGALSCSGEMEYKYNDLQAYRLKSALEKYNIKTVLTRNSGEHIDLRQRAELSAGKDAMISIHHDSVQPKFIAYKGNFPTSDYAEGFSLFVSSKSVNYAESLALAEAIGKALIAAGYKPSLHHADKIKGENRELLNREYGIYDFPDLVALKNSLAPAALIEAGVIVNPKEEKKLRDIRRQRKLAETIAAGAASFLNER